MLSTLKAWVEIDLDAIVHNIGQLQRFVAPTLLCPVVKAEAYGHGAVAVSKAAVRAGVRNLAVATIEEAIELRKAGIKVNLIVLGPTLPDQYEDIYEHGLTMTVASMKEVNYLLVFAHDLPGPINVHLKLDTGMGRIGFKVRPDTVAAVTESLLRVRQVPNINITGLFSHFAVSESADLRFAEEQYTLFRQVSELLEKRGMQVLKHICASGTIVSSPAMHMDMVRPGALIYGLFPSFELDNPLDLHPVMAVKARVMFINFIEPGESVGYDRTWVAKRPTRTAVMMYGYADGYSTSFSNSAYVNLHGVNCPVIGRVCMDQTIIDITDIEHHVHIGDIVHVIEGHGPSIMELVKMCGLSSREIQCLTTTGTRMPRVYFEGGEVTRAEWL